MSHSWLFRDYYQRSVGDGNYYNLVFVRLNKSSARCVQGALSECWND